MFNLFYLRFCFGFEACTGNSIFRILWGCILAKQCQKHNLTTHTHHTAAQTQNSSHHSQFTSDIFAASPSRNYTDQTLLSVIPIYRLVSSFPVYLSLGGIENLFTTSRKE